MGTYIYENGHINSIQPYYVMYNGQRYNAAYFNGRIVFGKTEEVEPTTPPTEPPTPEPPTQVTITAETNNSNYGKVRINNQAVSASQSVTVDYNTSLNLYAIPNNINYYFIKWDDNDTNATRTITAIEDKTYTAQFKYDNPSDYTHQLDQAAFSMYEGGSPKVYSGYTGGRKKIAVNFMMAPGYQYNIYMTIEGQTVWSASGTSYNNNGVLNLFTYDNYFLTLDRFSNVGTIKIYYNLGNYSLGSSYARFTFTTYTT